MNTPARQSADPAAHNKGRDSSRAGVLFSGANFGIGANGATPIQWQRKKDFNHEEERACWSVRNDWTLEFDCESVRQPGLHHRRRGGRCSRLIFGRIVNATALPAQVGSAQPIAHCGVLPVEVNKRCDVAWPPGLGKRAETFPKKGSIPSHGANFNADRLIAALCGLKHETDSGHQIGAQELAALTGCRRLQTPSSRRSSLHEHRVREGFHFLPERPGVFVGVSARSRGPVFFECPWQPVFGLRMGTVGNNQSQGIPVTNQLTLSLEPSLDAHRDVRECFAACVYRNGLKRVAAELDVQPSHLSEGLSGARNLDVALIEKYVEKFRDVTPILFLCARYLRDSSDRQAAAIEQLHVLMRQLAPVMEAAGLTQAQPARRAR